MERYERVSGWTARSTSSTGSAWVRRRSSRRRGRWRSMHMGTARAEAMNSDFEELLSIFNENGVRYLIVGGHAVMLYTEPRYTKDLDVWIDASAENAEQVYRSLLKFGAPLAGLTAKDFAEERTFYQMGIPPVRVD